MNNFKWFLKLMVAAVIILLLGVFAWPMWNGKLFGRVDKPAFVEVPKSYIEADMFIKNQKKDGNILHLPLTTGESATYYWRYGYNGVESSQLFFNSLPSISRGFNITHIDDALSGLSNIFSIPSVDDDKIISLLKAFNVHFIVLHKDMEWRGGDLRDPKELEKILKQKSFLEKIGSFGDLVVYSLKDQYFIPKLRLSQNIQYVSSTKENSFWPWLVKQSSGDLLTPTNINFDDNLSGLSNQYVIIPQNIYSYIHTPSSEDDITKQLPSTHILPTSPIYPLIILKEKVLLFSMPETDKFVFKVTLAGKRLVEAYKVKDKDMSIPIKYILNSYQGLLPSLQEGIITRKGGGLAGGEIPLESIFSHHLVVLKRLMIITNGEEKKIVQETYDKLVEMLKSSNLLPKYEVKASAQLPEYNRLISEFDIPMDANYEILQAHQNSQILYTGELKKRTFQVDDQIKDLMSTNKDNYFISYGFVNLTRGLHEISFYPTISNNLINTPDVLDKIGNITFKDGEFEVTSKNHESSFLEAKINPVTGGGWYQLVFESWIKLGDKFRVQLIQDTDPKDPSGEEENLLSFNKTFTRDSYNNFWNKYVFNLHIRPATTKASFRFLVEPWDDCRIVLVEKNLCKNKQIVYSFQHPSSMSLRYIEIKKILRDPIFLRTSPSNNSEVSDIAKVNLISQSSVLYTGQINLKTPQFLIFSETYHPAWKLTLSDGKKDYTLAPMYIANLFSNAWYIKNQGNYTFRLEFTPQNYVWYGIVISLIGLFSTIILMIWKKFKK